jgi:PTH1 family peptidyl-tRNA hydrolase
LKLLLGLGNPGSRYARTRHNAGWLALDAVAAHLKTEFRAGRGDYYEARARVRDESVVLAKPTTFMNLSGIAARELVERFEIDPAKDLLVLVDEVQLPLGRIRLRPGGSDGGHNGMSSVIGELGTDRIPRLRLGVGTASATPAGLVEFVLGAFSGDELPAVAAMCERARDAAIAFCADGIGPAMNRFNIDPEQEAGEKLE